MRFKDIDPAIEIWSRRKSKFITLWCHSTGIKRERINVIILTYEALLKKWLDIYFREREAQCQRKIEIDNSYIYLKCPSARCRYGFAETPNDIPSTFMVVIFKHYEPGKLLCKRCGKPLVTEEELQAEESLMRLGIRLQ